MHPADMQPPLTLADALDACCATHPDHGIDYVDNAGMRRHSSYPMLRAAALTRLGALQAAGLERGDSLLLQLRDPLRYLEIFWACQLGGIVSVPSTPVLSAPPDAASTLVHLAGLLATAPIAVDDCDLAGLQARVPGLGRARLLAIPALAQASVEPGARVANQDPNQPALMLPTSGSTGAPKIVMQTHHALLTQCRAAIARCAVNPADITLNWLPLEHVGAIVMLHLRDVLAGCSQFQVPTAAVIANPARWLDWLESCRATLSWAPHFAFARIAAMGDDLRAGQRDLRHVRILINAGEPIAAEQARAFLRVLAPAGLAPDALWPAWGMSETCSGVTFSDRFRAMQTGDGPVDLGAAIDGVELRIVDAQDRVVADGVNGSLQVRGACVTAGYFGNDAATGSAFADQRWFRTGDIGCLRDGRLTLTGRAKDVLIINGRNLSCATIEAAAQTPDNVLAATAVVFDAPDGGAPVLVYSPVRAEPTTVANTTLRVRQAVARACGLRIEAIHAIDPACIARTAIGKIQRKEMARRHAQGELLIIKPATLTGPSVESDKGPRLSQAESALARIWQELLGVMPESASDDFFALGGHSLAGIQLVARVQEQFGVELSPVAVFEYPTLGVFAARIAAAPRAHTQDMPAHEPGSAPDRAPPPAGSAESTQGLSPAQKRARLAALVLAKKHGKPRTEPASTHSPDRWQIDGPPGEQAVTAAPAAVALWLIEQLPGTGSAYSVALGARIRGPLDVDALRAALQALVDRHDALRASFELVGAEVRMRVRDQVSMPVPVERLAAITSESERDARAAELRNELLEARFDLARAPLIRARLIERGPHDHELILVAHHIVTDGWSIGVIARDLNALYAARLEQRDAALPECRLSYLEYARRAHERSSAARLAAGLAYWRERLAGLEPVALPMDRPRPASPSHRAARIDWQIEQPTVDALRRLSREAGATLYMALLAIFSILLSRHCTRSDIAVGTPVAGRTRLEYEPLVGYFVNMLVMRTDLSGDPGFRELLARTRAITLDAFRHDDIPFERLVAALAPSREPGVNPLFQVSFALQNTPVERLALTGTDTRSSLLSSQSAQFDLALTMTETDAGIDAEFEFASELFERERIERMAVHLNQIVAAVLADPDAGIDAIGMLAPQERDQLLVSARGAARAHAPGASMRDLFERQVERSPEEIALVAAGSTLTFRELDARANQLAHQLRALGVVADDPVAICLERGAEAIIAMIAVWKAAGAYLPLDPRHPAQRRNTVIADARARVLIADIPRLAGLQINGSTQVLMIDAQASAIAAQPRTAPPGIRCGDDDLAYVLYTSGSSGTPKGVMIPHRALVNHSLWFIEAFSLQPADTFVSRTTLAFDAAGVELWPALLAGARVLLATDEQSRDPRELLALVRSHRATLMQLVPGQLGALNDELERDNSPLTLRTVFVGGDVLAPRDAQQWHRHTGIALVNLYGPTECTIDASFHRWSPAHGDAPVPIGRAIDNCRVHVLDARFRPVPVGIPGEICIGGAGLARGYLGRPDLDAERFIADPLDADHGARLYRSGDLGRMRADGAIEYIGRIDRQVKVRGYRIELGDVEAALLGAGATQAAVLALCDPDGTTRLCAYVAPAGIQTGALRERLALSLPDYMIPGEFIKLEQLPSLPNGKLDRKELPLPTQSSRMPAAAQQARTPTEAIIAGVWEELLGIAGIDIDADFFALGGNSLSAARAVARIARALDIDLSLSMLFATPSIRGLALRIATSQADQALEPDCRAHPHDSGTSEPEAGPMVRSVPTSSSQQALWYIESLTDARTSYHVPYAIRITGELDVPTLRAALEQLVTRHEVLRGHFDTGDGDLRLVIDPAIELPLLVQRDAPDMLAAAQAIADQPFDRIRGPLWRVALIGNGQAGQCLVLVMHHIITDGWSMGILLREFGQLYTALSEGRRAELPALPLSYAEHASTLAERAADVHRRSIGFWRDRLAGLEPLVLPSDRPRQAMRTHRAARTRFTVPGETLDALKSLGRRHRATLYMVLLTAWQAVLARHSGQDDIAVGTPVAGRDRAELEPLVGYFVNMVVMRTDLSDDPSFVDALARVRAGAIDSLDHQQLPFDRLVSELSPSRDAGINPLFQVAFALHNAPDAVPELPGSSCTSEPLELRQSKFDLSLSLVEHEAALGASLEYASELFDAARIDRLTTHFSRVLAQIAANPDLRLSQLVLMDPDEQQRIRCWSQGPRNPFPADRPLAALFEQQVRRNPQACAVEYAGESLRYVELNARANRIAHCLRDRGVGPDSLVAICLPRGVDMLVALLGIVKSGAAYLPLDPQYPPERLRAMLDDAGAAILVRDDSAEPGLETAFGDTATLCIARDAARIAAAPDTDPPTTGNGHSLAYLMYTSGSTGQPKGARVTHRGVARLVCNTNYVSLGVDDVIAQMSNVSFDAATFEIWGAWLNGARLVVLPPETVLSHKRLAAAIRDHSITTMFMTTALFNAHAGSDPRMFAPLHMLIFGGEAADTVTLARLAAGGSAPRRLLNAYGPTETTTFATAWPVPCDPQVLARETVLGAPIGSPIANTDCHVLDAHGQPQPIGVIGELHIGGPGVALGYLNRDDLNAQRFIPDPDPQAGPLDRLYRTGDLACWRDDGTLLYAGRNDQQVKIRGFRIELGEIDAALRSCPGVREAATLVEDRVPLGKRLIACVVLETWRPLDVGSIRQTLRARLPEFMLPAAIEQVDALPINRNGKLDRHALLAGLAERARQHAPGTGAGKSALSEAALDETSSRLLGLWRRVLDQAQLDVDANFFESGGHSLLALRMLGEVERDFGRVLRVATLFEAPTARQFAALLGGQGKAPDRGCAVTIQSSAGTAPLFMVSGYGGEIVMFRDLGRALGDRQALVVLDTTAFGADELDGQRLPEVAARMLIDMRRIQPRGPYHLCGYSLGGKFVYEIARQLRAGGETVSLLALLDCQAPGYPPRRALFSRLLAHGRRIMRQSPAENIDYLAAKLRWLKSRVRERDLFENARELAHTHIAQSMKASAEAMFAIWLAHEPGPYGGSLLVIRAGIRHQRVGVIDEDPQLGWGALVDGPIVVRDLDADHLSMLRPAHSAQLAAILSDYLPTAGRDPAGAASRAQAVAAAGERLESDHALAP